MTKAQAPTAKKNQIRIIRWEKETPPSQEEAEARLHQEGYHSFCWYDVPGATYPRHKHTYDECLWILQGEIEFNILGDDPITHLLQGGDRMYLPANTPHTAQVPLKSGVTFIVGQKEN